MINPAATARLVAPPGRALSFTSRCLCTTSRAINLAAITVAADEYLGPTACTQKKSGDRSRVGRLWTRATMIGILPRHACSARAGLSLARTEQASQQQLSACALNSSHSSFESQEINIISSG
jgi:hypothetical protein